MKRANHLPVLQPAIAEWGANVRAFVIHHIEIPFVPENGERTVLRADTLALTFLEGIRIKQRNRGFHGLSSGFEPSPARAFFFQGMSGNLVGSFTGAGFSCAICNSESVATPAVGGVIFSRHPEMRA